MIHRYCRPEMESIWSEPERFKLMLEIELLAMEAMGEYNIIPKSAAKVSRRWGERAEVSREG